MFSHYKPRSGWPYTQQDIWLAVPPEWNAPPITQQGSGRWAGAFLTHDAMEVSVWVYLRLLDFSLYKIDYGIAPDGFLSANEPFYLILFVCYHASFFSIVVWCVKTKPKPGGWHASS